MIPANTPKSTISLQTLAKDFTGGVRGHESGWERKARHYGWDGGKNLLRSEEDFARAAALACVFKGRLDFGEPVALFDFRFQDSAHGMLHQFVEHRRLLLFGCSLAPPREPESNHSKVLENQQSIRQ